MDQIKTPPKIDLKSVIDSVAKVNQQDEKKVEETFQLVVFELDKEEYGVGITDLREIIKRPEITPVPNSPEFVLGILNLRGKIVVVIDLERRFSLQRENQNQSKHIIITELEGNNFGVLVDEVTEVLKVPISTIKETPSMVSSKIQADFLKGVVVLEKEESESRLVLLIDLPKLLSEGNLLKLGEEIKKEIK